MAQSLKLSDAELERLAEITEEDIRRVQMRWQQVVDRRLANLLMANAPRGDQGD